MMGKWGVTIPPSSRIWNSPKASELSTPAPGTEDPRGFRRKAEDQRMGDGKNLSGGKADSSEELVV